MIQARTLAVRRLGATSVRAARVVLSGPACPRVPCAALCALGSAAHATPQRRVRAFATSPTSATQPKVGYQAERPAGWSFENAEEIEARRRWVEAYAAKDPDVLASDASISVSYARSSGPGGQHVNKTSSKAVVRLSLDVATMTAQSLPQDMKSAVKRSRWLLPTLTKRLVQESPYYVASTHSLLISCDSSRSSSSNLNEALRRLHEHILHIARDALPGKTSLEQQARVRGLMQRERSKMKAVKTKRKDVKQGRGKVIL